MLPSPKLVMSPRRSHTLARSRLALPPLATQPTGLFSLILHSARCSDRNAAAGEQAFQVTLSSSDSRWLSTKWSKLMMWEYCVSKRLGEIARVPSSLDVEIIGRSSGLLVLRRSVSCVKGTVDISRLGAVREWFPIQAAAGDATPGGAQWELCLSVQLLEESQGSGLVARIKNLLDSPLPPLPAPLPADEEAQRDNGSDRGSPAKLVDLMILPATAPVPLSPRIMEDDQQCGSYGPSQAASQTGLYGGSYGGAFEANDGSEDDSPSYRLLQLSSSGGNAALPSLAATAVASLNERYQTQVELLKRIDSSLAEGVQTIPLEVQLDICDTLVGIADDFVSRATIYGRTIIEELFVSDEEKTIKPVQMGGMLGGRKYVVANIMFKVPNEHMFVGSGGDPFLPAMKVAAHELKGLQGLWGKGSALGLSFPLLCLVDFRGYRLLCLSILPIDGTTLVYGCQNASSRNMDVRKADPLTNSRIADLCASMGLAEHAVVGGETLRSPIDLEAHISQDRRTYCVDFSRVFPPVTPRPSHPYDYVFRLLRGELVEHYAKTFNQPLSADAYSPFSPPEPHNKHIDAATTFLLDVHIPQCAAELTDAWKRIGNKLSLSEELHRRGVNMRYLGRIFHVLMGGVGREDGGDSASAPSDESLANYVLQECVARACKNLLRGRWRTCAANGGSTSALKRETATFINDVFVSTSAIWTTELSPVLREHFSLDDDAFDFASVFPRVAHTPLLDRIFALLHISVSSSLGEGDSNVRAWKYVAVTTPLAWFPLDWKELDFGVRVKQLDVMLRSTGLSFLLKGQRATVTRTQAVRYLDRAQRCFSEALRYSPNDSLLLSCSAECAAQHWKLCPERVELMAAAREKFERAVLRDQSSLALRSAFAHFLASTGQPDDKREETEQLLMAASMNPNLVNVLQRLALAVEHSVPMAQVRALRQRAQALLAQSVLARQTADEWERLKVRVRPQWLQAAFPSLAIDGGGGKRGPWDLISAGSSNLRSLVSPRATLSVPPAPSPTPSSPRGSPSASASLLSPQQQQSQYYVLWEPHGLLGAVVAAVRSTVAAAQLGTVSCEAAYDVLQALPEPFAAWGRSRVEEPPAAVSVGGLLEALSAHLKLRIIVMRGSAQELLRAEYVTRHWRHVMRLVCFARTHFDLVLLDSPVVGPCCVVVTAAAAAAAAADTDIAWYHAVLVSPEPWTGDALVAEARKSLGVPDDDAVYKLMSLDGSKTVVEGDAIVDDFRLVLKRVPPPQTQ